MSLREKIASGDVSRLAKWLERADDEERAEALAILQRTGTPDRVTRRGDHGPDQQSREESVKTKSALPWFGSDSEVAAELASLLDPCRHVSIVFAGGLAILPHIKAKAILANDRHERAIEFYRVASGRLGDDLRKDLVLRCSHTLAHPSELSRAVELVDRSENIVLRAWAFWAICWLGRKGKGGTKYQGGSLSVRRTASGGTNASRLRAAVADLDAWRDQFLRCEFTADDFRDVLPKVKDQVDCGAYLDPPWLEAGRNYKHPFGEDDHVQLAEILQRFTVARIVVRYGDAPLIRELYDGWTITPAAARNQSGATTDELWITNFEQNRGPQ